MCSKPIFHPIQEVLDHVYSAELILSQFELVFHDWKEGSFKWHNATQIHFLQQGKEELIFSCNHLKYYKAFLSIGDIDDIPDNIDTFKWSHEVLWIDFSSPGRALLTLH